MQVDDTDVANAFIVSGRGELHLAILIETMRREGYEFSVSRPEVILRDGPTGPLEPVEEVFLEVPEEHLGTVTEMLGQRRGRMEQIRYGDDGTVYCEYLAPTRGLLGFRQPFLTITRGTGIYHALFSDFEPFTARSRRRAVARWWRWKTGVVTSYALRELQQRGAFFVQPGDEVYAGQVVGQHIRDEDLVVNVCKTKQLGQLPRQAQAGHGGSGRPPHPVPRRRHRVPERRRAAGGDAVGPAHTQEGIAPRNSTACGQARYNCGRIAARRAGAQHSRIGRSCDELATGLRTLHRHGVPSLREERTAAARHLSGALAQLRRRGCWKRTHAR